MLLFLELMQHISHLLNTIKMWTHVSPFTTQLHVTNIQRAQMCVTDEQSWNTGWRFTTVKSEIQSEWSYLFSFQYKTVFTTSVWKATIFQYKLQFLFQIKQLCPTDYGINKHQRIVFIFCQSIRVNRAACVHAAVVNWLGSNSVVLPLLLH